MGGLLLRQYLNQHKVDNLGRAVMLGPPNQGSHVVDKLKGVPGFKTINGPAGMQMGTKAKDAPQQLPAANFELGIIAGTRSVNPLLSTLLPNPDDGKVSVEHTKLEGMKDHISLPVTHTFMMKNKKVIEQVLCFLRKGEFKRANANRLKSALSTYPHYLNTVILSIALAEPKDLDSTEVSRALDFPLPRSFDSTSFRSG